MAAANPILTPDRGKAHSVALAVLCVLAAVQVAAMIRAVWLAKSKSSAIPAAGTATQTVTSGTTAAAPPVPASAQAPVKLMPPPSVPGTEPPAPALASVAASRPPPAVPSSQPAASVRPLDAETEELIDLARQLRPLGDLNGALDVLQRASEKVPDHPKVLTEIAQTYEMMGLSDKAAAARQKAAAARLPEVAAAPRPDTQVGAGLAASTGLTTPNVDASKILSIGACEVLRDRSATRGEKLTLRLPIRSQPGVRIDPNAIDIGVFFFDLVNGEKVEQTKADAPVNTWVDTPVDWKDGQERLDVLYFMPEMTPEMIRNVGRRSFHGYIVKLYYQRKLQDTVMEPASLRSFGTEDAPPPVPATPGPSRTRKAR